MKTTNQIETRKCKMLWVEHDGRVVQRPGYTCVPANPGWWWIPSIGYSCHEGSGAYDTQEEALAAAIASYTEEADKADRKAKELREKLNALKSVTL